MILKVALSGNEFRKQRSKTATMADLTIAIVEGNKIGGSGQSKIFLKYNDKPIIIHFIDFAKKLTPHILFIAQDLSITFSHRVKTHRDIFIGKGPLSRIYTALYFSESPFISTLPFNMPFLTRELYQLLYENRSENRPTVIRTERGVESLISLWPKTLIDKIEYHITDKNLNTNKVLLELNAKEISVKYDQITFFNLGAHANSLKLFKDYCRSRF
jgi:molybdopterin-guanine dinucleotide biosynthesis protein A